MANPKHVLCVGITPTKPDATQTSDADAAIELMKNKEFDVIIIAAAIALPFLRHLKAEDFRGEVMVVCNKSSLTIKDGRKMVTWHINPSLAAHFPFAKRVRDHHSH